jgi:hypothetical protein
MLVVVLVMMMMVVVVVAFLRPLAGCASLDHASMNLLSSPSFDQINSMVNNTCI